MPFLLNENAEAICDRTGQCALAVEAYPTARNSCGTRIIDCGVAVPGGLEAGRLLAEVCLSGLGSVAFVPAAAELCSGTSAVMVQTDHPAAACMASQYAGWRVSLDKYFAMGSGPMRALGSQEPLFEKLGLRERRNPLLACWKHAKSLRRRFAKKSPINASFLPRS